MLNEIQEKYFQQGFVTVKNIFDSESLDEVEYAIFKPFEVLSNVLNLGEWSKCITYDQKLLRLKELKDMDLKAYLSALRISQNDPAILKISSNKSLQKALQAIGLKYPIVSLKPYPIILASDIFIPEGYNIRPVHQEWPVMQGSHNGVVVWFPLHKVTQESSGIEIYPESHKLGVLPYEVSKCGSKITDEQVNKLMPPKKIELDRGDIVIFSAFSAHCSAGNSANLRVAMSIRFNDLESLSFAQRGYVDNSSFVINREPLDQNDHKFEHY